MAAHDEQYLSCSGEIRPASPHERSGEVTAARILGTWPLGILKLQDGRFWRLRKQPDPCSYRAQFL
jgi:hypothetical protein